MPQITENSPSKTFTFWGDITELPEGQEYLMVSIDSRGRISHSSLGSGQVNHIYKKITRNAGLDESSIEEISGHSMRADAAQDLLNSKQACRLLSSEDGGQKPIW